MEMCLDEGTLQAFLDNELDNAMSLRVGKHISECESCAEMLAVVEEETAFVFSALDPELNSLVPTQRLWTKINDSIETERRSGWFGSLGGLFGQLSMPSMAALASLVIVAGSFAFFLSAHPESATVAISAVSPSVAVSDRIESPKIVDAAVREIRDEADDVRAVHADFVRPEPIVRRTAPSSRYVEGEATYVRTISKLERTVDQNKDALLSASSRFAYEKDLAVVDDAIARMRREVRRNPKSDIARQVLFSSYQNKIDLLNSVNDRGELMASISR
jgi:hypothetical protein